MKKSFTIRGYLVEVQHPYKRLKIIFNDDNFTENFIRSLRNDTGHSPTFEGGFWVKYTSKIECYVNSNKDITCSLDTLIDNHIICEVLLTHYTHTERSGWYLSAKYIYKE